MSKALRAGDLCILQDGGSLTLEVTGKNQGKWLYRGRKQGSRTLIKLIGKLYIVFHSSNAALRASILEYLGVEGLNINFLPSSIAAAVVSFGTSNFNSKGIPCSIQTKLIENFFCLIFDTLIYSDI